MGGPGKLSFQRDNGRHLSKKKKMKKTLKKNLQKIYKNSPPKNKQETFSLPSSLPSLTCKSLFLCAKKIISFFEDQLKKKSKKKNCTEGPCVVLCGIKNCKNWKRAFSKSTPVYPRLLWTKALPISKKSFFLEKKNLFCLSKLSIKNNAPYYIHVFLLYIKDGDRAVFFTIL